MGDGGQRGVARINQKRREAALHHNEASEMRESEDVNGFTHAPIEANL
jgi:hypothetical protein